MSGTVRFSPAQRQVIDATGWVTAVAGAGAGKTGLLVGRILQLLERGTRPSEILTVTFCTTAAAELRHRVTEGVRERAQESTHWQSILQSLPLLGITTIHGLCYRVVTEHPVESGAGFGLTVLDDVEWGVYREQKLAMLLAELPPHEVARIPGKERSEWLNWLLERPEEAQQGAHVSQEVQAVGLSRLFTHVDARLMQLKREEGLANFADLERWAATALTHTRVRDHYAVRIHEILIDELQDTSPAQWEILQAIAGQRANVVTVGDEKQAIYGFRGGDAQVFNQAQSGTLRRSGEVVHLLENYRSSPAIVEITNSVFSTLLQQSLDTPFVSIRAARTDQSTEVPAEYHQVIEGTAASRAGTLGRVLTGRFQALLGHPILDRSSGRERPARWQDMALLIRSRTHLGAYENALRESGVPYVIYGGRGLFTRPEVREAVDLLAAVTDPADDLLLISVLRGTYFRWSESQLLTLAQRRAEFDCSFWQTLRQSSEGHARHAATLLKEWRTLSATRSAAQLLHEADLRTGFSVVHAAQEDGALRLGNLQRLREVVYRWEEQGRGTVASVAQHCQALRHLRHTRAEEPEAVSTQTDAVQILTVHQAKGLEWPIVAYANAVPNGYHHVPPLILHNELGLLLPHTPHWGQAVEECRERDQREETRLLYVACTRARDRLIMGSSLGNARSSQNKARELQQSLPSDVPVTVYSAGSVPASPPLPTTEHGDVILLEYQPGTAHLLPSSLPVTALQRYANCPRQFAWHDLAGFLPLAGKWMEEAGGKFPASTIGDAVHRALQHGWNERQMHRRFAHLPEAMRSDIVTLVSIGRSERHAQLQSRPWQRELHVSLTLHGRVWHGIVDAYDPNTRSILDYKTDQDIEPEKHLLQMALYAHALDAREALIFYLRHEGAPKAVPIVLRNSAYLSPPHGGGQTHSGFVRSTRYAA